MSKAYKQAGVDIKRGYAVVREVKALKTKTYPGEFANNIGLFGGMFDLGCLKYKHPVLVSSVDGVGTKVLLAIEHKTYKTIGQDLVAMCVNDIICQGAKPLYFLDYIAVHKIELPVVRAILKSIVDSLDSIGCSLLGGETAEMNKLYAPGHFDLAGMVTGVAEKDRIIRSQAKNNEIVIGLQSSGIHSNGYSLVRKILEDSKVNLKSKIGGKTILSLVMEPTKLYVNEILYLLDSKYKISSLANITGGGFYENCERVLSDGQEMVIEWNSFPKLPIFNFLQEKGKISNKEMANTFNNGIGFILTCAPSEQKEIIEILKNKFDLNAFVIGKVTKSAKPKRSVVIEW